MWPQAALEHYAAQRRIMVAALGASRRLWGVRPPADFDAWFDDRVGPLTAVVVAAQGRAVADADDYTAAVLDELGTPVDAEAQIDTRGLVGVASDGRALESLLYGAVITSRAALARGEQMVPAWQRGGQALAVRVQTQVADASRVATGLATTVRPRVGHVRMLNPPSCPRCAVLAGRHYRKAAFLRHPGCFPAGTVVDGPLASHATRRWFEGELVTLSTAGGQDLSLTGNHPVLTRRGWVPANLIEVGDEVVRRTRAEGATPLVVPDHHQVPARIEDLWRSYAVLGVERVPTSAEHFHGDGRQGEVHVVAADGALGLGHDPTCVEVRAESRLTLGASVGPSFSNEGLPSEAGLGELHVPGGDVGGSGLGLSLGAGHLGRPVESSLRPAAAFHASLDQSVADGLAADAVMATEGVFGDSGLIRGDDRLGGQLRPTPRWNAPSGPLSVENGAGYADRGRDLLDRLAGQVELDRVIERSSRNWAGHVYNLTSMEGWHSANNLIVSNCDCRMIPATERGGGDLRTDPRTYFDSLGPADQDRLFTKAGAEAIRAGADPAQVVNARRDMYTASAYGRDLSATHESVTRRGAGYRAMSQARYMQAGGELKAGRYRSLRAPRLMPEAIEEIAEDRDDYLRLLTLYGFIR